MSFRDAVDMDKVGDRERVSPQWGRKGVSAASIELWLDEIRKRFGLEFSC